MQDKNQLNHLSNDQKHFFKDHGYLILNRFFDHSECDALIERMNIIVDEFSRQPSHQSVFSTITHPQKKDQYFLESAHKIHYFFEEDCIGSDGQPDRPLPLAINKVGHSLHRDDPVFNKFCHQDRIRQLVHSLDFQLEPEIIQSMYIFKQPEIGGEVLPHQDSTFIQTKPDRVLGMWLALDDADRANGCLWGLPGQSTESPKVLFNRNGNSCTIEVIDPTPWDPDKFEALEVPKGSIILFDGHFPHLSHSNQSQRSRHAFTLHFIDKSCHYLPQNWIPLRHD